MGQATIDSQFLLSVYSIQMKYIYYTAVSNPSQCFEKTCVENCESHQSMWFAEERFPQPQFVFQILSCIHQPPCYPVSMASFRKNIQYLWNFCIWTLHWLSACLLPCLLVCLIVCLSACLIGCSHNIYHAKHSCFWIVNPTGSGGPSRNIQRTGKKIPEVAKRNAESLKGRRGKYKKNMRNSINYHIIIYRNKPDHSWNLIIHMYEWNGFTENTV